MTPTELVVGMVHVLGSIAAAITIAVAVHAGMVWWLDR